MIDPRELRISNWVQIQHGALEYKIEPHHFYEDDEALEHSIPIELTEEKLIEFGFYNNGIYNNKIQLADSPSGDMDGAVLYKSKEHYLAIFHLEGEWYYELTGYSDDYGSHHETIPVKYVHKLQNLVFELNNIELTIK